MLTHSRLPGCEFSMSKEDGEIDVYLLRMKRALLAGESLHDDSCVLVDSQILSCSCVVASCRGVCSFGTLAQRF